MLHLILLVSTITHFRNGLACWYAEVRQSYLQRNECIDEDGELRHFTFNSSSSIHPFLYKNGGACSDAEVRQTYLQRNECIDGDGELRNFNLSFQNIEYHHHHHHHHYHVFCPKAGPSLKVQEPRLQFCRRQVFHRKLNNQGCSFTRD